MFRRTNNNTSIYNTGSGIAPIEFLQIPGFAVYLTAAYLMPSGPLFAQSTLSEAEEKLLKSLNIPYSTSKTGKKYLTIKQVDFIERFMKDLKGNEKVISTGDNPEVNNDNAVVDDNQSMLQTMLKKINQEYIDFLVKTDADEVIFKSYNHISESKSKHNDPISDRYPRISDILFGKKPEREQYGLWLYAWSIPRTISFLISVVPVSVFRMLEMGIEYLGDKLIKKQIKLMDDSSQNSANALYVPLAVLYVALFLLKLVSLVLRSVLSHDEIWKKARQMDVRYILPEGSDRNTMGPIEIAARIFSTILVTVACIFFPPLLFKFAPAALPAALKIAIGGISYAHSFLGSLVPVKSSISLSLMLFPAVSALSLLYAPVKWGMKKAVPKQVVEKPSVTPIEVSPSNSIDTDPQIIREVIDQPSVISTNASKLKSTGTALETIPEEDEDDASSVDTIESNKDSLSNQGHESHKSSSSNWLSGYGGSGNSYGDSYQSSNFFTNNFQRLSSSLNSIFGNSAGSNSFTLDKYQKALIEAAREHDNALTT